MWINIGRLFMLLVWGFLLLNVVRPSPKPLKYFLDVALIFMAVMHLLQLFLLKATLTRDEPKFSVIFQIRMFLFGVFEMLAWQKKLKRR
ncbi:DUF1145 family protein [Martelella alba]|uniref:DUF1145 family protein n=1 Tax=Martelella alba TaxID=2590451 RepID=A0ABY2SMP0_9HYPH|nr:DUF1145 family protein [Martelella alba]TKI07162.1 DUF1145 family protein [Martelella alba]